jgi:Flp pilus assembly protein TadD
MPTYNKSMEAALSFVLFLLTAQPPAPAIPEDPVAASIVHLDGGRPAEAVTLLEPVVTREPGNLPARFNLAIAYSLLGRDGEAIDAFGKVLELSPKLVEAQLNLGQLLVKAGRFAERERRPAALPAGAGARGAEDVERGRAMVPEGPASRARRPGHPSRFGALL